VAGIGFELRKLARLETISSVAAAAGHAAIIAAGPWLFTIFSLASITMLAQPIIGLEVLATFRAVVIYAFAISLVTTAPVAMVATRLVADALWARRPGEVRGLLFGAYLWALAAVTVGLALVVAVLRPAQSLAMVLALMTASVALIWVTLSFCGAVRDYAGVTRAFLSGLLVALAATVAAAVAGFEAAGMACGFLAGLQIILIGLARRVLATFPQPIADPLAGARAILHGFAHYRHLALGALAGTIGVWIDKWMFWGSTESEAVAGGFLHSPIYDSAMFIASLAIIPSLAAFVVRLETDFFERYQHYYATIKSHGTLRQIETARVRLAGSTLDSLTLVTVAQAGICAVLVLAAPSIIELLGLQFRQVSILRYGALGVVFQFVFIACASMLLFFDRRPLYLAVQALFLALVAGLTAATLWLGEDYYGVGYFAACVIAGFVAYRVADSTFDRLNFLTFLGNNPSIEASTASRRRGLLARLSSRGRRTPGTAAPHASSTS